MEETEQKVLDRYSYSKLSCYGQCHLKFKIHYLDKNFVFSESIATEFGTLVHATEEALATALQNKMPINYIELKNKFIIGCKKSREFNQEEKYLFQRNRG